MLFGYCNCEIRCRFSGYIRNSYVAAQNKRFTYVYVCVRACYSAINCTESNTRTYERASYNQYLLKT